MKRAAARTDPTTASRPPQTDDHHDHLHKQSDTPDRVKAMRRPSGDQLGAEAESFPVRSVRVPVPSAPVMTMREPRDASSV